MGVNDWKIWHYLGIKKENLLNEVHPIETTESLLEFLNDLHFHQKQLEPIIKDLQELAKEKLTMKKELQGANFAAQSKHFDDLLERYSSLEDDVAINGIRIRLYCRGSESLISV